MRGGERPHEGVKEDLPLSDDGVRCMDPVATLQGDRRARLKAGGCLPLPFLDPSTATQAPVLNCMDPGRFAPRMTHSAATVLL